MPATGPHTGKLILHRVPRPVLIAMIVAVVVFIANLLGVGGEVAGEDLAPTVDRGLEGLVMLATMLGWGGLKHAISDPGKSVVD